MSAPAVATLDGVTLWYENVHGRQLHVVDDVSLQVNANEFVSMLGPSGCGKTTILNILAGFIAPSQGVAIVEGQRVRKPGPDRPVVFQAPNLFPWLSVLDNVTLASRKRRVPRSTYLPRAKKVLEEFGLGEFEKYKPYELSGGMKQRAQIARALMGRPTLLLMDEPFGALDSQTRVTMQEQLVLAKQHFECAVLFITHDVDEAIMVSDRIVVMSMRPGRLVGDVSVNLPSRNYRAVTSDAFGAYRTELLRLLHRSDDEMRNRDQGSAT